MDFPIFTMSWSISSSKFTSVISPTPFPPAMDWGTSGAVVWFSEELLLLSLPPDPRETKNIWNTVIGNTDSFFISRLVFCLIVRIITGKTLGLLLHDLWFLILTA